ncbi:MAG: tripartite tricarboxylate transporter substrate binding protein, partial [Betaproteobacteria bacterium]|nr:tripartite tricarboxylate transporter substrate binding protein [Betaproteobacteria bacterium]
MKRRQVLMSLPAAAAAVVAPRLALAQAYPSKPIRYIVPVAAGGGSDMVGRTVTERWGKLLNQSF